MTDPSPMEPEAPPPRTGLPVPIMPARRSAASGDGDPADKAEAAPGWDPPRPETSEPGRSAWEAADWAAQHAALRRRLAAAERQIAELRGMITAAAQVAAPPPPAAPVQPPRWPAVLMAAVPIIATLALAGTVAVLAWPHPAPAPTPIVLQLPHESAPNEAAHQAGAWRSDLPPLREPWPGPHS